jgi:hypothetical protein
MLGRLLSTFSPATYSSRNPAVLESVTEEEHTSGLLFPDASLLRRSNTHAYPLQSSFNSPNASSAGAYDDRGGLELDVIKDFRIIIAQNALGDRDEPCILLDSRGSPDPGAPGLGLDPQLFQSGPGRHSRTSSLSKASRRGSIQTPQAPSPEASSLSQPSSFRRSSPATSGAFSRARGRSSTFSPTEGVYEPLHNRPSADSTESGLLNCIFGSTAFSYRGSSTKMHVLSTDSESGSIPATSPAPREVDMSGSRGTSTRGPLARTYSSGPQPATTSYFSDRAPEGKSPSKVTVLITRMFSVNLPEAPEASVESSEMPSSLPLEPSPESGYPFPDVLKRRKIKEKKTPMYAVAITIQIPVAARIHTRPQSRLSAHAPEGLRPAGSMSFSLDSDNRWSSTFLDDSLSPSANLDDRLDILMDHWDAITRTLSHLEKLARREILILLKKIDALSGPQPKPVKAPNMQRTNQTIVQLRPNVLAAHAKLREEMLLSAQRISAALRIPRVVIGQNRWGVWREEARWIARLLADKEHGLFFLVLITAFLGNHTEWLNSLGPEWYRRRHYQQQKAQQDAEPAIANRTVIISDNKMVARRLIFLLSAFLPPKQRFEVVGSPLRPGTSTSMRPLSQSPPNVTMLRQESLRRTINRRARAQRLTVDDTEDHQRSTSVSSSETHNRSSEDVERGDAAEYPKNRRDSDVRSIRTASLPIHANDTRLRNCSTATTSTTTPGSAVPVAHFTSRQQRAYGDDSYASAKLLQNLRRSESSSTGSDVPPAGSKWGNILSGIWSSRQELSADDGGVASVRRDSRSGPTAPRRSEDRPQDNITSEQIETELSLKSGAREPSLTDTISIPSSPSTARHSLDQDQPESHSQPDHIKDSPLKLSVRSKDGVVDVDLPFPGFVSLSSSGDSTLASPKKTRTSVTSVDAVGSTHSSFSNFNFPQRDHDGPNLNVAGWLKSFHEDFLLQAVRPYHGIVADIKRAMIAEPTPSAVQAALDAETASVSDRWVDVATTLVADTRTCTVKRLRLRRKVSASGVTQHSQSASFGTTATPRQGPETTGQSGGFFSNTIRSHKNPNPTSALADWLELNDSEVKFIEEPVMDVDGTLVDAVERVLVQSGQSSLAHSRAPSPHRGGRGEDRVRAETPVHNDFPPVVEVPRGECRKMVLGALEEVVRSVAAEHCREEAEGDFGLDTPLSEPYNKRRVIQADNTLREGIRKWLLDVEEAC